MNPSDERDRAAESLRESLKRKMEADAAALDAKPDRPTKPPSESFELEALDYHVPSDEPTFQRTLQTEIHLTAPGLAQMTAFCRQLATLIGVGIPLLQALAILAERVKHPRLQKIVGDVARRVERGGSFSEALEAHPRVFSPLVVNVVRIGESGGILEGALTYLADIMERRYELRRRVMAALAYPTAVLVVCAIFLLVTLGVAVPVFAEVYRDNKVDLPPLTNFVVELSTFVQRYWWLVVAGLVALFLLARLALSRSPRARRAWDYFCLKAPIVRVISVKVNVTRTATTLGKLLRAGIPLLEALMICAETAENTIVAEAIKATHDNLEQGGQLEAPLREADIFPALVVDMVAIGDEAGRLELMFEKIAETYESDVNQSIATLNAVIEPAMIALMAGVVFMLALAVLQPYWGLASTTYDF